jgi:D-psicose/D-tagatose/L-ribulose 3-epimerase
MNLLGLSSFVLASPFSDHDREAFERTARFGYDLIEVCIEDPALLTAEMVATHASDFGLKVGICGAFGPDRDVSHEDRDTRLRGISYLKSCVRFAHEVGSPHVAGPMFAPTGQTRLLDSTERVAQRTRAAESLREVADFAGARGVSLAIEPLNRFETDLINTTEQGLELCDQIGAKNVGLLLDTFHLNIEEKSIADAVRAAGPRLIHVQVSENDRGAPGSGHFPWDEFFSALRESEYAGQIVVESFLPTVQEIARAVSLWRPVAASMDELAADAIDFIRANWDRSAS